MKVNLNISERIFTLGILNAFKGKMETMSTIMDDIKEVTISDEDKKKCEWVENMGKDANGNDAVVSVGWNDIKGGDKELEFQPLTLDYLLQVIEERNEKGDLTFQDKAVISLKEKLTTK